MMIKGLQFTYKGGEGSGYEDHPGRPGKIGGSLPMTNPSGRYDDLVDLANSPEAKQELAKDFIMRAASHVKTAFQALDKGDAVKALNRFTRATHAMDNVLLSYAISREGGGPISLAVEKIKSRWMKHSKDFYTIYNAIRE